MGLNKQNLVGRVRAVLGEVRNYGDETYAGRVPYGSEGSLHYRVLDSEESPNSINAGVVVIWGDLRDKGTETRDEVIHWLQEAFDEMPHLAPRSVNIMVEVESGPTYLITLAIEGCLEYVVLDEGDDD
jgi:hypothetical protein